MTTEVLDMPDVTDLHHVADLREDIDHDDRPSGSGAPAAAPQPFPPPATPAAAGPTHPHR